MSASGGDPLLQQARRVLLDALEALAQQRDSVIVIGAQAIYLHTGAAQVALAEATKDSDLLLDPRSLGEAPLIEEVMKAAGFYLDPVSGQPGAWLSSDGVPVDLMVPAAVSGRSGGRSVRIPPHANHVARRADGLEAVLLDSTEMDIHALADSDDRVYRAKVAGPASLLIAKLHKLGERRATPGRLIDKDAHDVYRLLVAISTNELADAIRKLLPDSLAGPAASRAIAYLEEMFAAGPTATGSEMAGRAESGVGEPETVANSVALLAADLLEAI